MHRARDKNDNVPVHTAARNVIEMRDQAGDFEEE